MPPLLASGGPQADVRGDTLDPDAPRDAVQDEVAGHGLVSLGAVEVGGGDVRADSVVVDLGAARHLDRDRPATIAADT